jgi:Fe-S oxidoreductase/nitrate reductase gamma subunit
MIPTALKYGPVPGWAILWTLFLVAAGIFAWRVAFLIRLLRLGRPDNRFEQIPARLKRVLVYVFGQRRLLDEPLVGIPHVFIFYGFVVFLFASTGLLLQGLFPTLKIPTAETNPVLAPVVDIFAVLVLAGLAVSTFRRYVLRPQGLQLTFDAALVNALIAALMVTYLAAEGFRLVTRPPEPGVWAPVGKWLGGLLGSSPTLHAAAPVLYLSFWWGHVLILLFFLGYLPHSKHLHLMAAPFSAFFSQLGPAGRLAASGSEKGLGAERLGEFTWRQLLSAFACAECGRCERVCPSFQAGEPGSPRQLIHNLKEHLLKYGPELLAKAPATGDGGEPALIGSLIPAKELWACTTCMACAERCPVMNEHLSIMVDLRRRLVERGEIDAKLEEALRSLARYGNSFGQSDRKRTAWTQGLAFKPKDARKEPVEWLWFVGEYASYHPSLQGITRALAQVLKNADVDYGILFEAERNTGNDVRRVGEEGLFELLRDKNMAALAKAQFHNLFSTDPHVYNTLKNEYPELNHGRHTAYHYSELLADLLTQGRLKITHPLSYRVAYHDPCYLGRYNGVYEAPRRVLKALGVDMVELPRNHSNSLCCGGGGGRVWMDEIGQVKERPSESRVREAAGTKGVQCLVVACPKDYVMFSDALKTTGLEGRLVIKDLTELVAEATAA